MEQQLLEFAANHWILTLAFFTTLGFLLWTLVSPGFFGPDRVSPTEAIQLINHEGALVLDVRTDEEIAEGSIINAMHLPHATLAAQIKRLEKYRTKPIIAACRSGGRSSTACSILRKHGFERVYNLSGGVTAWRNAGLPLARKKK